MMHAASAMLAAALVLPSAVMAQVPPDPMATHGPTTVVTPLIPPRIVVPGTTDVNATPASEFSLNCGDFSENFAELRADVFQGAGPPPRQSGGQGTLRTGTSDFTFSHPTGAQPRVASKFTGWALAASRDCAVRALKNGKLVETIYLGRTSTGNFVRAANGSPSQLELHAQNYRRVLASS